VFERFSIWFWFRRALPMDDVILLTRDSRSSSKLSAHNSLPAGYLFHYKYLVLFLLPVFSIVLGPTGTVGPTSNVLIVRAPSCARCPIIWCHHDVVFNTGSECSKTHATTGKAVAPTREISILFKHRSIPTRPIGSSSKIVERIVAMVWINS
jgi:hypothetical protein